eukprot:1185391-Prorocentrum_minimum.AAC.4
MTWHPASLASWTANCPVPPAAAVTNTVSPGRTRPHCSSAREAVRPEVSSARVEGVASATGMTCLAPSRLYSANPPYVMVATGVPTGKGVEGPAAAMTPTPSNPTWRGHRGVTGEGSVKCRRRV